VSILHLFNVITAYRPTPFAKHLKQSTRVRHDAIESHPFVKKLINGKVTDLEYAAYLKNLLSVYGAVESKLFDSDTPVELFRTTFIIQDLNKYKTLLNLNLDRYNFWEQWTDSIKSGDELTVAANFYIRWLGDMYGGQIMSKNFKFNSALKFKNVRSCIKTARSIIENIGSTNPELFIERVNQAYEHNYILATRLEEIFNEKSS